MELKTAYQAKSLVIQHLEAEALLRVLLKQREQYAANDPDTTQEVELHFELNGLDSDTFDLLDYYEVTMFQDFMVDLARKRVESIQNQIERLGQLTIPSINVLYKTYLDAQQGQPAKPFMGVTLRDIISLHPAIGLADEVWLVGGDEVTAPRQLKQKPPEPIENLRVIRMSYEQYQLRVQPAHHVHIDDMRLKDLPLAADEVAAVDEVWIVQGDHQRRLK